MKYNLLFCIILNFILACVKGLEAIDESDEKMKDEKVINIIFIDF